MTNRPHPAPYFKLGFVLNWMAIIFKINQEPYFSALSLVENTVPGPEKQYPT